MSFFALLALAVGLAMDATAVAATKGLAVRQVRLQEAVRIALLFGVFQALMPAIGAFVGARFASVIQAWDHWVAFVLLAGIGAKMIYEALKTQDDGGAAQPDPFAWRGLIVLAVATSIDALAAGLTLSLLNVSLPLALVTIGATTTALSFVGVYVGRRFGSRLGKRLDIFGGVLLIGLGSKTLFDHLHG